MFPQGIHTRAAELGPKGGFAELGVKT